MARLRATLQSLCRDRSGASAIVAGLLMVSLLGFAGLGIDLGADYTARRTAQNAADSAAASAAAAAWAGATNPTDQAQTIAASYGLVNGRNGVAVTVNRPPQSGSHLGALGAVEVIISRPAAHYFSGLFVTTSPPIRARAVAIEQPNPNGDGCVLALNATATQTILLNGQPQVSLTGCSVYDNSSDGQALSLNGSASLAASSVNVVGGYVAGSSSKLNVPAGQVHTGVHAVLDPYANVGLPTGYTPGTCNETSRIVNSGTTVTFTPVSTTTPYVFCNGLTINGGASVTFAPGIYVVDGGAFIINSSDVIRGSGVTFVLTSHTGSGVATATINGSADVQVSAPTSGQYKGILFYQDRRAASGTQDIFNGGAQQILTGALYFPKQMLLFNGGTNMTGGGCTQLIADEITFNGNARVALNCSGAGVQPIGGWMTELVE